MNTDYNYDRYTAKGRKWSVSAANRMRKQSERKKRRAGRLYQGAAIASILFCCCCMLFHKTVSSATSPSLPDKCYKSIEIQKGDSLWSIARTYCSSQWNSIEEYIEEVKAFNGLHTDEITTGHYIAVPYYPTF